MPPCLQGNWPFPGAGSTASPGSNQLCAFTVPLPSAFSTVKWDTTASSGTGVPQSLQAALWLETTPLPGPHGSHASSHLLPRPHLSCHVHQDAFLAHTRSQASRHVLLQHYLLFSWLAVTGDRIVVSGIMFFFPTNISTFSFIASGF